MCHTQMWIKSVFLFGFLLVAFRPVQSNPINQETSLVFKLTNTIRINGTDLNELNCAGNDSQAKELCSNITEVTCQNELDQIKSCLVSNKDSIYFNTLVVNQKIDCNKGKQIRGNCRLTFSPDPTISKKPDQTAKKFWETYKKAKDQSMKESWATFCIAAGALVIFLCLICHF